jgi:hypothetical protein
MQNATGHPGIAQYLPGILIGLACMDDNGQLQTGRKLQLPSKNIALHVTRRIVVVVVESGLSDSQHPRVGGQTLHHLEMPLFNLRGVVWVNSDAGVDPGLGLGHGDAASHIVRPASIANRQNAADAGVPRTLDK